MKLGFVVSSLRSPLEARWDCWRRKAEKHFMQWVVVCCWFFPQADPLSCTCFIKEVLPGETSKGGGRNQTRG